MFKTVRLFVRTQAAFLTQGFVDITTPEQLWEVEGAGADNLILRAEDGGIDRYLNAQEDLAISAIGLYPEFIFLDPRDAADVLAASW